MSSIVTSVPQAPFPIEASWCLQPLMWDIDSPPSEYNECFDPDRDQKESDFQTICCDGKIIDITADHFKPDFDYEAAGWKFGIKNFVCCRAGGRLIPKGIRPIDNEWGECVGGEAPTPLASLAATNTDNAETYKVTYQEAEAFATGTGDWTMTEPPSCMWFETKYPGVDMASVTVPAADVAAPPRVSEDSGADAAGPETSDSQSSLLNINGATFIASLGLVLGVAVIGVL